MSDTLYWSILVIVVVPVSALLVAYAVALCRGTLPEDQW